MILGFEGGKHLWSFRVSVELFHQVHPTLGVDRPINNTISQAHSLQMNCNDAEHAGPLGHDHAAQHMHLHMIRTFAAPLHQLWLNRGV